MNSNSLVKFYFCLFSLPFALFFLNILLILKPLSNSNTLSSAVSVSNDHFSLCFWWFGPLLTGVVIFVECQCVWKNGERVSRWCYLTLEAVHPFSAREMAWGLTNLTQLEVEPGGSRVAVLIRHHLTLASTSKPLPFRESNWELYICWGPSTLVFLHLQYFHRL